VGKTIFERGNFVNFQKSVKLLKLILISYHIRKVDIYLLYLFTPESTLSLLPVSLRPNKNGKQMKKKNKKKKKKTYFPFPPLFFPFEFPYFFIFLKKKKKKNKKKPSKKPSEQSQKTHTNINIVYV